MSQKLMRFHFSIFIQFLCLGFVLFFTSSSVYAATSSSMKECLTSRCFFACMALDDKNQCTVDTFDSTSCKFSHTPIVCSANQTCDKQTGRCSALPNNCLGKTIDDSNPCTADSCNPSTGIVTHVPLLKDPSGKSCVKESAVLNKSDCEAGNSLKWVSFYQGSPSLWDLHEFNNALYARALSDQDVILKSIDDGKNWESFTQGLSSMNEQQLVQVYKFYTFNNYLYVGTTHGVYRLAAGASNWENVSNAIPLDTIVKKTDTVYSLLEYNGHLYAGTKGFYQFQETNLSWKPMNQGLPVKETGEVKNVYGLIVYNGKLYAGIEGYVYRFDTNNESWTKMSEGLLPEPFGGGPGSHFAILNGLLYLAGSGAYVFQENNQTWKQVNTGLPTDQHVKSLRKWGANLYAGVKRYGIYRYSVENNSWQAINEGTPLSLDPSNNIFLEVVKGDLYAFMKAGVFRYECSSTAP